MQVIKAYPNGKMSQHIHNLKEGDSLECKGPIGKLDYKPNMKKKLGMVRLPRLCVVATQINTLWYSTFEAKAQLTEASCYML